MSKFLTSILMAIGLSLPVMAEPIEPKDYKTYHSLGCMILKECNDGVTQIKTLDDIRGVIPDATYDWHEDEISDLLYVMDKLGIEVYIADGKYFPPNNRGVYIPKDNTLFLNKEWMKEPHYLAQVLRHEGWHAAQDCMAGTIDNSYVAVIHGDATPEFWRGVASSTYPSNVVPWEQEAMWASSQQGMTNMALLTCASDHNKMWDVYEPTPLTRQYLVDKGYLNE
jgi:hypothetical protein